MELRVDIGLAQNRSRTVRPLPVVRQLAGRQPQRVAGQMLHRDPREQKISCIPHHQMQVLAVGLPLPADPLVAAAELDRREVEQQAAQRAAVTVAQEVAQVLAERLAVAERVVACDEFVPLRDRLRAARDLQPQRGERGQGHLDGGPGSGPRARHERLLPAPSGALLGRQGQDREPFEFLQQTHRQLDAVAAGGGLPPQVRADGLAQFVAAEFGERADDLLDVGDLPAGEASAAEAGGLEILDQRVQSGYPPHSTCQNSPLKSSAFARKSFLSHKLLISRRLRSESTRPKALRTR